MTDHDPHHHHDDGVPADASWSDDDPAVRALRAELLATSTPPDAPVGPDGTPVDVVARAVDLALADPAVAGPTAGGDHRPHGDAPAPVPLPRGRRAVGGRALALTGAAAAVLLVVALGVVGLGRGPGDDGGAALSSAQESTGDRMTAGSGPGDDERAGDPAGDAAVDAAPGAPAARERADTAGGGLDGSSTPSTVLPDPGTAEATAGGSLPDLGDAADVASLLARARDAGLTPATASTAGGPGELRLDGRCPGVMLATGRVGGRDVLVVADAVDPSLRVVDAGTCEPQPTG